MVGGAAGSISLFQPERLKMAFTFFPSPQRNFTGQRWVRISLRTVHLIAMAFLVGGTAQGYPPLEQPAALWATLISGLLFIALEIFNTGVWLFQLKGLAVIVKVLLLGAAIAAPGSALGLMVIAIIIGGISSHMPGKYRYYSLLHGRIMKE
jgi:hypothetical protein